MMAGMPDLWNPGRYSRFASERERPFFDLMKWVEPLDGGLAVDLGCGTGRLTEALHRHSRARSTLGLDSSPTMLAEAPAAGGGLSFARASVEDWQPPGPFDLVFSNACLHWLEDHAALWPRLWSWLRPGGQLAIGMPANHDHPSQTLAARVAGEPPFREALGGWSRRSPVRGPESYASWLFGLGAEELRVGLNVYVHPLESSEAVVEWVRGTTLTDYQRRLEPALYERFLERYRAVVREELPGDRPYCFTFKRILMRARKAPAS